MILQKIDISKQSSVACDGLRDTSSTLSSTILRILRYRPMRCPLTSHTDFVKAMATYSQTFTPTTKTVTLVFARVLNHIVRAPQAIRERKLKNWKCTPGALATKPEQLSKTYECSSNVFRVL
jgi:hypothetical protein